MRRRFAGWSSCTSSCSAPTGHAQPLWEHRGDRARGRAAGAAWTRVRQTFTSVPRHPVVAPGQGTRPRTRLCRARPAVTNRDGPTRGSAWARSSRRPQAGVAPSDVPRSSAASTSSIPVAPASASRVPRLKASSAGAIGHSSRQSMGPVSRCSSICMIV